MRLRSHTVGDRRLVDLIPVVNIVLLLMFFFLLSWSFVLQQGVEVRLPVTSLPSTGGQGRHVITLKFISADHDLMLFDERGVDMDGLKQCLKGAAEKNLGDWITLNAEDMVSHGRVQAVAALVMQHGFRVTVATQRAVPAAEGGGL